MNDENKMKAALGEACRRGYQSRLQTGNGGNISARTLDGKGMLVKTSGSSFQDTTDESFVLTDFDGVVLAGGGKPSREVRLHGLLYRRYPEVNVIFHVHAPHAIAWSHGHHALPRVTWQSQLKLAQDIPVIRMPGPTVRAEDVPLLAEGIAGQEEYPYFILADHGIVTTGRDALVAEQLAEFIEETAQIAILESLLYRAESKP